MTTLIIERPDLQNWRQKTIFGALTAFFWVVWILLWLPLITLLGWVFFGYQFNTQMLELGGSTRFFSVLVLYLIVIACLGGGLALWALYNHYRFKGVDRRKVIAAPTHTELADWSNRTPEQIAQWKNFAVMTVHHDASGRIESVTGSAR